MQLPEIPLDPPLRKGETPCLRRTHVKIDANRFIGKTVFKTVLQKIRKSAGHDRITEFFL